MRIIEIWKDIPGYEGYYQVSNTGEVRSLDRVIHKSGGVSQNRKGHLLPRRENEDGYRTVRLSKDGVRKQFSVHSLVAKAFVAGYFDGAEVNHKDCDRANNIPENLEWVTHADNVQYTILKGRHISQTADYAGEKNPNYGNSSLSKKYAEDPELAKAKQSRPGVTNGRCLPVRMITAEGDTLEFGYMVECAAYMIQQGISRASDPNSVATLVSKAAKNGRPYCGCYFELLN